jgi:hypothetical protein
VAVVRVDTKQQATILLLFDGVLWFLVVWMPTALKKEEEEEEWVWKCVGWVDIMGTQYPPTKVVAPAVADAWCWWWRCSELFDGCWCILSFSYSALNPLDFVVVVAVAVVLCCRH